MGRPERYVSPCGEAGLLKSDQDGVESSFVGEPVLDGTNSHRALYLSSLVCGKHTLSLIVSVSLNST